MPDLTAPRPVPTREESPAAARNGDGPRLTFREAAALDERDQLDARAACAEQERDELADDLRELRSHHTQLHNRLNATENDLRSQTEAVRELAAELERERNEVKRLTRFLIATAEALHLTTGDDLDVAAIPVNAAVAHDAARNLRQQLDRANTAYRQLQDQLDDIAADPGSPSPRAQDEPDACQSCGATVWPKAQPWTDEYSRLVLGPRPAHPEREG